MTAAMSAGPPPSGPAVDVPTVRRRLRVRARVAAAVAGLGLVLLVGFVIAADLVDSANQQLVDSGARAAGLMDVVHPDSRYRSGNAVVSYRADGRDLTGVLDLGSDAANYHSGQQVTVYYDAGDPTRFTIAGEQNQPEWSVLVMIWALVLGVALLAGGGSAMVGTRRARRLLRSVPWRSATVAVLVRATSRRGVSVLEIGMPPGSGEAVGNHWAARVGRGGLRVLDLGSGLTFGESRDTAPVWIAGPRGRRAVLAPPGGASFVTVRVRHRAS